MNVESNDTGRSNTGSTGLGSAGLGSAGHADSAGIGHSVQPVPPPPPNPRQQWEARITFLRSRAAVARAEVAAIEAMHRDPDTLEDLLSNASPEEVAMAEAVEHRISERVIAARQVADAAEADYERALLDGADQSTDDSV
ncbi:hypothetical protein [Cryobacterium soli]|uniref:hypothetical protein n=1 Tax=Cryobacterium soli TaxID=2220095 RepID=UPI000E768299|nr:hypothetical protein [Cryobacterium soli]